MHWRQALVCVFPGNLDDAYLAELVEEEVGVLDVANTTKEGAGYNHSEEVEPGEHAYNDNHLMRKEVMQQVMQQVMQGSAGETSPRKVVARTSTTTSGHCWIIRKWQGN